MSRRGGSFHLCSVTVALRSFLLSKFSAPLIAVRKLWINRVTARVIAFSAKAPRHGE